MEKELIKISNLNFYYIDSFNIKKHTLKNIDFSLYENESLCILGRTGCGKSTLVKVLVGMIPDNAVYSIRSSIINSKLGLVLQESSASLNPTLKIKTQFSILIKSVYTNVSIFNCKKMMENSLKEVNIKNVEDVLNKYPFELSRGMNQRITVAMALINKPKILILDEPTSSIDASNRAVLLKLLQRLKKKYNMGLIYVTHDIKLAESIANRIIIMQDGKIIENIKKANDRFNYDQNYSRKMKEASNMHCTNKNTSKNIKVLGANNLCKKISGRVVLDNINFDLFKGETLGIIGPSGCGKSTLCKIIMGIYNKDSGTIINYQNMNIDMINQDAKMSLNPNVKVFDILNEKNKIKKSRTFTEKEILDYFKNFGIPANLLYKYPTELSGGQKQLILIIRAILYDAEILILDEPTSSLDVLTQKQVLDKLKAIKQKYELTYIFISHDRDVMRYMCDRIINIEHNQ